ncbi:MAG: NAD(P)-dependent glycerol-3-phosphate dehydrogenase [Proteobacteria bacterium]|nr:NAD(P)-dependent glycerol-3-phosphate dehydrogenase [Pseudomonadota bacterium]MDA1356760.1 NAD(P)-dependent glycerol-3-phosphate dehydrogenase [Pseudomonadota bacterium]
MTTIKHIGVVGGGAWGTALAATAARAGRTVILWAREEDVVASINGARENKRFLPGISLDPAISASTEAAALSTADLLLLAMPAQYLRSIAADFTEHLDPVPPIVICAKGIELESGALMSDVARDVVGDRPIAVLSGPTFAHEVARGLPSAVTLACGDSALGEAVAAALGSATFRPYLSDDMIGAQIGGALKNIMAIAAGIAIGRGLGENARAAIMTRGFAEMVRLARARGARLETLAGLSGLGDLVLTCSSTRSRNFSLGQALGEGEPLQSILDGRDSVAEGVTSAPAVVALGEKLAIDLPIAGAVDAVLHRGADIGETIAALLSRPFRPEF